MKIIECEQGSPEWYRARMGRPTSSMFSKIITPEEMKISKSRKPYMHFLIAEKLLNRSLDDISHLEHIDHGKETEPLAADAYEFEQNVKVRKVGFIVSDDERYGCSPDRLIIDRAAAVEIKCPAPQTQVGYILDGFAVKYRPQVQGHLLIGNFEYVDWYSYSTEMNSVRVRTYRDEPFIKALSNALDQFCDELAEGFERVRASGAFYERITMETPIDAVAQEFGQ